jgi:capsular polysaccharide transport system permease protein
MMDQETRIKPTPRTLDLELRPKGALARVSSGVAQRLLRKRSLPIPDVFGPDRKYFPANLPLTQASPYLLSFIFFVVLPSLVAILYLAFIASDQYVSESRFILHSAQTDSGSKTQSALTSVGSGSLPSLTGQEAYVVTGFIHSHAIINDLSREMDIRAIFRRPEADFWATLKANATAEELLKYWNGMITTSVDGPSGIVTVYARAFRPDDALQLAQAIVRASERLANDISVRARNDAMSRAEAEVRRSEGLVRQALADMRVYRDKEGFIDPIKAATSTSELLLQTMSEKIRLQNEYFATSTSLASNAPTLQTLKVRLQGLDKQIDELKAKLTGNSQEGKTIAASLIKFEELELQRVFAEKLYSMAQDILERARLKAEQQNMYVSTFVPPGLPQEAKYPERLALSFLIPLGLLILWGIFAFIGAAINDHRY